MAATWVDVAEEGEKAPTNACPTGNSAWWTTISACSGSRKGQRAEGGSFHRADEESWRYAPGLCAIENRPTRSRAHGMHLLFQTGHVTALRKSRERKR